jgi:ATP-dependent RNA helicase DeaD
MNNNFNQYNLSKEISQALSVLKYIEPTEIQQKVLPYALKGRDIVAAAKTGSGKTAAFGIPLCEAARWDENVPECLVLEPTRELAVQVEGELFNIGRNKRLKVVSLLGGMPVNRQTLSLKQKTHIIVGTPGRIMDHVRRGNIDLSAIKHLVIDEADLMLDMGFFDEVSTIVEGIGETHIMLFSATMEDRLSDLIDKYMIDPIYFKNEADSNVVETIDQIIYESDGENKYSILKKALIKHNPGKAMIFCDTREMTDVLCRKLGRDGIRCGMIHGEIDQRDRIRTIDDFKSGKIRYLIATDVAARGIDVDNLTHVFNYDFPTGKETYVHRIGRTGRKGNLGVAISVICPEDSKMFQMVKQYINMDLKVTSIDDIAVDEKEFWNRQKEKNILIPKKGSEFNKTITKISISGGKKSKMRAGDIVGALCSIKDITAEDIGIIDIRESYTYVEILNKKGNMVIKELENKTIKGKIRKIKKSY